MVFWENPSGVTVAEFLFIYLFISTSLFQVKTIYFTQMIWKCFFFYYCYYFFYLGHFLNFPRCHSGKITLCKEAAGETVSLNKDV